jgi:hypothetical protein
MAFFSKIAKNCSSFLAPEYQVLFLQQVTLNGKPKI